MAALVPVLSPHGALHLKPSDEPEAFDPGRGSGIAQAFARGPGHGLLHLGTAEVGRSLPPLLAYWRDLGTRYVAALCALPGLDDATAKKPAVAPPGDGALTTFAAA